LETKDKMGYTIGFCVFIAIGLWAILDPAAMDGYIAMGSRGGVKLLFADYWSRGLGVTVTLLGVLAMVGLYAPPEPE